MNPELWNEISPYLDEALAMPDKERAGWLAAIRGRDPELGARLQALLDEYRVLIVERFLEDANLSGN